MKIKVILRNHRFRIGLTLILIVMEAVLSLLFPLYIGKAIDNMIHTTYTGVIALGVLGIAVLVVGVVRRVLDSRFYAKIYRNIGAKTLSKMDNDVPSKKVAHLSLIRELVEFLENAMPELITNMIGLVGVIGLIATLNLHVFYGSLLVSILVCSIYWLTRSKTIQLNTSSNDEFEKQVAIISTNNKQMLKTHLERMMKWNIKLSDLEAINFSISWMILMVFLVLSIVVSIHDGIIAYGSLFALVMYVFQYMENVVNLPLFYQNWLRLQEIKDRLEQT